MKNKLFSFFKNKKNIWSILLLLFCIIIPILINSIPCLMRWFSISKQEGMSTKNLELLQNINNLLKQQKLTDADKVVLINLYVSKMDANTKEKDSLDGVLTKCNLNSPDTCIKELKRVILDIDNEKISTNNTNLLEYINNVIKNTTTKLDYFNLITIYIDNLDNSDEKKELNKILKDRETCSVDDPNTCIKALDDKTAEYINASKAEESEKKVNSYETKINSSGNAATDAQSSVEPIQKPPS